MTITLDPQRLDILVKLIAAAGSRLGDPQVMMASAEMIGWLESQKKATE